MSRESALEALVRSWSDLAGAPALVVTGAGVSLASGLPTFRGSDPGAVWANDIMEKGTYAYFRSHPVDAWTWYLRRFGGLLSARPNPAHHGLVDIERWYTARGGEFLLVTQNIDGLHRAAGSVELVEVHGRADRVRCAADGCDLAAPHGSLPFDEALFRQFRAHPGPTSLPRCPQCRSLLRPHVLWFDETYDEHDDYHFERVLAMAERAALVLFAGTSFSVGVTDLVLTRARARGVPTFTIDPAAQAPMSSMRVVAAPAEIALVDLAQRLLALGR